MRDLYQIGNLLIDDKYALYAWFFLRLGGTSGDRATVADAKKKALILAGITDKPNASTITRVHNRQDVQAALKRFMEPIGREWAQEVDCILDDATYCLKLGLKALRRELDEADEKDKPVSKDVHNMALAYWDKAAAYAGKRPADKMELTGKDGGPVAIKSETDLSKLSVEELRQLEGILQKAASDT